MTDKEAKRRADRRERQRRWRARVSGQGEGTDEGNRPRRTPLGASVTIHLTDRECAVLDAIAAQLYRDHPHDPASGKVSPVFPGRPAAVRELIRLYQQHKRVRRPASRGACADFWRREAAYRKATRTNTRAERPDPPW